ncbi:MAG: winged helix-turn-helix domain-containing protein [Actinobacteria bacterium]|nr:winged helix-turn-helix domain-containing protein [Actinomycetota bacterium]
MLELALVYGTHPPVVAPVIQEDLAALAGTSRATVNRVLRAAERRGLVELGRGRRAGATRTVSAASRDFVFTRPRAGDRGRRRRGHAARSPARTRATSVRAAAARARHAPDGNGRREP